jgi:hypothetical protein
MKKTYLLYMIVTLFAMFGCTKVEVIDLQGEVIATKIVPKTAGEFILPITVVDNPRLVWKVRSISEWLHVKDADWKQNAYTVTIGYDSNESSMYSRHFAREGYLIVDSYDGFVSDTVVVKQRGITPQMQLEGAVVEASQTECKLVFNTNLVDECRRTLVLTAETAEADGDWIESITYLGSGTHLLVKFSANSASTERVATIKAAFTDACDETTTVTSQITQKAFE